MNGEPIARSRDAARRGGRHVAGPSQHDPVRPVRALPPSWPSDCWRERSLGDFWGHMLVARGAAQVMVEPDRRRVGLPAARADRPRGRRHDVPRSTARRSPRRVVPDDVRWGDARQAVLEMAGDRGELLRGRASKRCPCAVPAGDWPTRYGRLPSPSPSGFVCCSCSSTRVQGQRRRRWRARPPACSRSSHFVAWAATSCGSGFVGDCSGGRFEDGRCVNTQPAVHWTAGRAAVAIDHFTYAPMVRGRLSDAKCRIVARRPAYEATADCTALFTAPPATGRARFA